MRDIAVVHSRSLASRPVVAAEDKMVAVSASRSPVHQMQNRILTECVDVDRRQWPRVARTLFVLTSSAALWTVIFELGRSLLA